MTFIVAYARRLRRSYIALRWAGAVYLLALALVLGAIAAQAIWHIWPRFVLNGPTLWLPAHGWVKIERGCRKPADYLQVRVVRINDRMVGVCE